MRKWFKDAFLLAVNSVGWSYLRFVRIFKDLILFIVSAPKLYYSLLSYFFSRLTNPLFIPKHDSGKKSKISDDDMWVTVKVSFKKNTLTGKDEKINFKRRKTFKEMTPEQQQREKERLFELRKKLISNIIFWQKRFRQLSFFKLLNLKGGFKNIDTVWLFFNSILFESFSSKKIFRTYYRVFNSKSGFYFYFNSFLSNNLNFLKTLINIFLVGFKSFLSSLSFWFLPLTISLLLIYYSMVIRCLPFNKVIFTWIVFLMFSYWLLSGFVFFFKKYQFGKFTSSIQRFWKRSYILFWLIEFSLFSVYFYLTLNANNESWYMFDQLQVFKLGLFSWRSFFFKILPLTLLIVVGYLLLLTLKWNIFSKHSIHLFFITFLLIYIVWSEFYQFFHVVNFYGNFNWIYDIDEKVWSLELETRKTRTVNHYIMLMLLLKFWHIVFIFIMWFFFVLRVLEVSKIKYPLLAVNLQNFLILYLFAWVTMFPWFKFIFRRYLDTPYYWFYINNRRLGYRVFFNDMSLYWYALCDYITSYPIKFYKNFQFNFMHWSFENDSFSVKKSIIKNLILQSLSKDYK